MGTADDSRIRNLVVDRLLRMNARHATHAWLQRRAQAVGPHGCAFLYLDPGGAGPFRPVAAATRLVDDGPEVRDAARLLYRLTTLARDRYHDGFDPRSQMSNRCDPMTGAAAYLGVGVSSLDTADVTWQRRQQTARGPLDIPGRCFGMLTDGTMLLVERGAQDVYGEVRILSTHDLNVEPGIAARHWSWRSELYSVPDTYEIWRRLYDLHELAAREGSR